MIKPINFLLIIVAAALTAFILLTSDAFGQSLNGDLVRLRPSTVPATCNTGDLRTDANDGYALKQCVANSWNDIGANPFSPFTSGRVLFGDGTNIPATSAGFTFNAGTGVLTATTFNGGLSGTAATAVELFANPADCAADTYATIIAANGDLTCSSITNASTTATAANTGSTIVLRDVSGNFAAGTITATFTGNVTGNVTGTSGSTTGNAATATALAADPSDCSSPNFARGVNASGTAQCAQVDYSELAGTAPAGGTNDAREYVTNGKFETDVTGWTTYDDAAAAPVDGTGGTVTTTFTRTTTASEVLRDSASGELTKDASNRQGEGVCVAITLDRADVAGMKATPVSFEYDTTASYASGDVLMYAINVTTSTVQAMQTIQSATAGTVLAALTPTRWNGVIYPTDATNLTYKVCAHIATTNASAWDMHIDSFHHGNQNVTPGAIVTAWEAYTPTISAGFGTVANVSFYHRRVGQDREVRGTFTAGTVAGSLGTITIPSGDAIGTMSIANTSGNAGPEVGSMTPNGATNQWAKIVTATGTSTSLVYLGGNLASASALTPTNVSSVVSSSSIISVNFKYPIANATASAALSTTETMLSTVRVRASGNPASAAGDAPIIFPTRDYDTTSSYSTTTGLFTAPKNAYYRVHGFIVSPTAMRSIKIFVNSAVVVFGANTDSNGEAAYTGTVYANKGDTISIRPDGTFDVENLSTLHIEEIPDFSIFSVYGISELFPTTGYSSGGLVNYGITAGQYGDLDSETLNPGEWDCDLTSNWYSNGATTTTSILIGLTTTSGNSSSGMVFGENAIFGNKTTSTTTGDPLTMSIKGILVTTPTIYYFKAQATTSITNLQIAWSWRCRKVK